MIKWILFVLFAIPVLCQDEDATSIVWADSSIDTIYIKSTCPCYYFVQAVSKIKDGEPLEIKPLTLTVGIEGYDCGFTSCTNKFDSGIYPLLIIDKQQIDYSGRPTIDHTGNHSASQSGVTMQRVSTLEKTLPDCLPP